MKSLPACRKMPSSNTSARPRRGAFPDPANLANGAWRYPSLSSRRPDGAGVRGWRDAQHRRDPRDVGEPERFGGGADGE